MNAAIVSTILVVLATHLALPILLNISLLLFSKSASQIELVLAILCCGSFSLAIFLAGSWSFVGYGWRYVVLGLFAIAAIKAVFSIGTLPLWTHPNSTQWLNLAIYAFLFVAFTTQSVAGLRARAFSASPVSLSFPLQQGTYYVGHGGSTQFMNYHHPIEAQRYALDVLKLNRWGLRAEGLFPIDLEKYEIFGDDLYSPCNGEVVRVIDGLEDRVPPDADRQNLAGNHIVLKCNQSLVLMAHMKKNSILVKVGDNVTSRQLIGQVGNSGNTSEPHLHIHAVQETNLDNVLEGTGIPIIFNGQFLVRNDLVKRSG